MRRNIALVLCLSILLTCSACVNFFPITVRGVLESENPKMTIIMDGDGSTFGNYGELTQDDGSVIEIVLSISPSGFCIYENKEFREDGLPGINTPKLFTGKCRQKGDTIRLILKDDEGEIILKKVGDISESSE